jgi:hypothetical protein
LAKRRGFSDDAIGKLAGIPGSVWQELCARV